VALPSRAFPAQKVLAVAEHQPPRGQLLEGHVGRADRPIQRARRAQVIGAGPLYRACQLRRIVERISATNSSRSSAA
jgi:hypothetical protein